MRNKSRRGFVSLLLAHVVLFAGCTSETQAEQVPIRVENQSQQQHNVAVEWIDITADSTLLDLTLELPSGTESEPEYADPISADTEYRISVVIDGYNEQATISGGGLRSVKVDIEAADQIIIDST